MSLRRAAMAAALAHSAALAACGLSLEGTMPAADDGGPPADAARGVDDVEVADADLGEADASAGDGAETDGDASAGGPMTFVQGVVTTWSTTTSQTASIKVTDGDLLVVAAYWEGGLSTISLSDSLGNTWASTTMSPAPSCLPANVQIWYAMNAKGGADVVTVTGTVSATRGMITLEYAGIAATGALEWQAAMAPSTASNAIGTPDVTTFSARDVIVAAFADLSGTGSMTPGTGYTARGRDPDYYSMVEDDLPGVGPGTHAVTAALPATKNDACWTGAAAAFKAK
jgi:hypothetical protein